MLCLSDYHIRAKRQIMNKNKALAIFEIILMLFSLSCTHRQAIKVNRTEEFKEKIQNQILMPHQRYPIEYLINNPEIKGLLINHYMGTGKTYLALGFCEYYQDKEVIILGPSYLRNNWLSQIKTYGLKNSKRFKFLSFENAIESLDRGLFKNKLLIIDEVHNFVKYLNSEDEQQNQLFAKLFEETKDAQRILGLTGTPIYNNISDIALLLNLVSGENLLTLNQERFRVEYSQKDNVKSFWRGELFESNMLYLSLPVFFSFLSFAVLATPLAIIPGAALGVAAIPVVNTMLTPLSHYDLRKGNFAGLTEHINKYLSYFRFENPSSEDFPSKTIKEMPVPYNVAQMDYFIRFMEEDLLDKELKMLLQGFGDKYSDNYIKLSNSKITKTLKARPGSGREIGNLSLPNKEDTPPKFLEIEKLMRESPGKIGVFSSFYENGIKPLYDYLCDQNLCEDIVILNPVDSDEDQAKKIDAYNQDKKKIILFTFSEGVNLFKTRQLHILEPVLNPAILEQAIGRAVRYRSHASLPPEQRHVDVYLWRSELPRWDWDSYQVKRQNWLKRYGELSEYSNWGVGRSQIDKNYYDKLMSPDEKTDKARQKLERDSKEIMTIFKDFSIEKNLDKLE